MRLNDHMSDKQVAKFARADAVGKQARRTRYRAYGLHPVRRLRVRRVALRHADLEATDEIATPLESLPKPSPAISAELAV